MTMHSMLPSKLPKQEIPVPIRRAERTSSICEPIRRHREEDHLREQMYIPQAGLTARPVNTTGSSLMAISNSWVKIVMVAFILNVMSNPRLVETASQQDLAIADVSCLTQKLNTLGFAPPQFEDGKYKVKEMLEVYSGPEGSNEMHLLVYGPQENTAILYDSFLRTKDRKLTIFIGQWATFKLVRDNFTPDELPGGLATHKKILGIMRKTEYQTPLFFNVNEVRAAKAVCIWKP